MNKNIFKNLIIIVGGILLYKGLEQLLPDWSAWAYIVFGAAILLMFNKKLR